MCIEKDALTESTISIRKISLREKGICDVLRRQAVSGIYLICKCERCMMLAIS